MKMYSNGAIRFSKRLWASKCDVRDRVIEHVIYQHILFISGNNKMYKDIEKYV